MHPLSFAEYFGVSGKSKYEALEDYMRYGGMLFAAALPDELAKEEYLKGLFEETYLKDIVERHRIDKPELMAQTLDFLCSTTGSLTNANNITKSLVREYGNSVSCPNCNAEELRHNGVSCICIECDSTFSDQEIEDYAGPWHVG